MYADDIALITETREQMQQALNILDRAFADWGLQMNLDKTKIMRVGSSDAVDPQPCIVRDQAIKEVKQFKYLGSTCSADLSLTPEITSRVCAAGHSFSKLKKLRLWNDPRVSKRTKLTIHKVIVQTALLYACETWAVTAKDVKRLEVFQLECLRCIRGVTLMDKISNDDMRIWSTMPKIADLLSHRRLRWLGHIARMTDDRLPNQLLFGTIMGTGRRGRPVKS
jgi:hypothetical protein